jgi:hypothetical protein
MDNQPGPDPQNNQALFPTLTAAQLQRISPSCTTRNVDAGTTLVEQGDATMPFIVVLSGELEIGSVHPQSVQHAKLAEERPLRLRGLRAEVDQ